MWPNKLLSLSLLAIVAGLSLPYILASNTVHVDTKSLAKSPLFYTHSLFKYNASATKEVVSGVEEFHARHFVDSRFTTEELAMYPEAKAVVEFLGEPLQRILAFKSKMELFNCEEITRSLETCAVWSISANTNPATARPFLHAINARVRRCLGTLDRVMQQHNLLKQLMQRTADGDEISVIEFIPLLGLEPKHAASVREFSWRASSLQSSAMVLSWRLQIWNGKNPTVVKSLAGICEYLVGQSEKLATVLARHDAGFAEDLPMLLENCRQEPSFPGLDPPDAEN